MTRTRKCLIFALALACQADRQAPGDSATADSIARAVADSLNRAQPDYVVDSILPIEEELRRFRTGIDTVLEFTGGAASRESLARDVVTALSRSDTVSLTRMALTRGEYAWLVYPTSPLVAPPYRQAPGVAWMMLSSGSVSGLHRLLARLGGNEMTYDSHTCAATPVIEGDNRVWNSCTVSVTRNGQSSAMRLFSAVIERNGKFKILSFSNDF
jgi:hypothetical protein